MKINPKIADALGMDMPPEKEDTKKRLVRVEPHEITLVDNPELPDMTDAETRLLEAEKQLELVIDAGLGTFNDLDEVRPTVEPRFLSRHIETSGLILGHALDAIKHKTELQMKKMDMRMKQKGFGVGKKEASGPQNQTNFFVGSREELRHILKGEAQKALDDSED